jgi:hypothetical protein
MLRGFLISLIAAGLTMGQALVQNAAAAAGGAAAAAGAQKIGVGLDKILSGAAGAAAKAAAAPAPAPPQKHGKPSPYQPTVNRAGGTEVAPVITGASSGVATPGEVEALSSGESVPNNPWVSRGHVQQHEIATPAQSVPAFTPFSSGDGGPVVNRGSRRTVEPLGQQPPVYATAGVMAVAPPPVAIVALPVIPPTPAVLATPEKLAAVHEGESINDVVASLGTPASKIEMYDEGNLTESLRIESHGNKIGTILVVNGLVTSIEKVAN